VYRNDVSTDILYLVEIRDSNDAIEVNARMLRRFGGIFNYEDVVVQGYNVSNLPDPTQDFRTKAGDTVLVAFMNGEGREAVILGGISHPGRNSVLPIADGPQYISEFNGVQTSINSSGEYTLTFKGIPTNIDILDKTPSIQLPAPTYNTTVGTTYMKFDQTGGWEINDNATSDPQNIHIDKAGGQVLVNSGNIALSLMKASEAVSLTCKTLQINASTSINETTGTYSLTASSSADITADTFAVNASSMASITSPSIMLSGASISLSGPGAAISVGNSSIKIGSPAVDLLVQVVAALTALGNIIVVLPPNTGSPPYWTPGTLSSTPQWAPIAAAIAEISTLT
jgi:hypothetical protein